MRMTSMGSQVAAPTSAFWPTATRRGPAAAAPASAWAVMGSHARVSEGQGLCARWGGWEHVLTRLPTALPLLSEMKRDEGIYPKFHH